MRPHVKWPLTVLLAGSIVAPVASQAPLLAEIEAIMEKGVGKPLLLANNRVKEEIKLSSEQDQRVRKVVQDVKDKYQAELRKARGDRQRQIKIILDEMRETRDSINKALPDILKPEQLKRLDQIQIQVNGIASFKREDVQKKLMLTDEQKAELRKIGDGLKQQAAEALREAANAPVRKGPAAIRRVRELKDEADRKAMATLRDEQKRSWKEMTGEKIDVKIELPIRPGGRFGKDN
ncbi:MAG: hypothetical protein ACYC3I_02895 [Gemmataceae bacterium]